MSATPVYSEHIGKRICDLIVEGQTLRSICNGQDGMPASKSTVFRWLADDEYKEFRTLYERARQFWVESQLEEIIEISDDATRDYIAKDGDGAQTVDHEHISRSKLRVDTRKWAMARMAPKKYGDKLTQEVTGADGAALMPVVNMYGRPE